MPGNEEGRPDYEAAPNDERRRNSSVATTVARRRDWRAVWQPRKVQALTAAQERRGRVLAHSDLAAQLTAEPIGYARPEQWNGYVPPGTWGGTAHREVPNDSPRRAALVELCAEALRREQKAGKA